jgi:hypothetical protein
MYASIFAATQAILLAWLYLLQQAGIQPSDSR